jgi:hypothetical protein
MGITGVKNESSLSCAMVNREAVRARQTVIAATRRQSWRAVRQGGYSVKTVRELSVGGRVSHSASSCARRLRASAIATATARRDSSVHVGRRRTPSPAHHVLIFANAKWPDDAIRWPCGRPRLSAYWGLRSPAYASTSTWTRKTGRSCSSTPASSALRASCQSGRITLQGPAARRTGLRARTRTRRAVKREPMLG